MMKTTQKAIRNASAIDVSNWSNEALYELSLIVRRIAYSSGVYGLNGGLYADGVGNLYKTTGRGNALFILPY